MTNSYTPTIDQIISQAGIMNSTPFDIEALFEDFDDQPSKTLHTTDNLMHSLIHSTSFTSQQQQQQQQNIISPMMNTPSLDSFATPFTPATGFMGDSPMMSTPYMDPLIGSHFSTPMMDTTTTTPFMGAVGMDLDCMEQYFTPALTSEHDFSSVVDPSQLAIESQPTMTLQQQEDDSLFPPLSKEEEQQKQNDTTSENHWDLLFDDIFGTNEKPKDDVPTLKRKHVEEEKEEEEKQSKQVKTNDTRLFVCPICDRGFSRRYNLGTHIKTHNKDRVKPFACHLCTKSFDRKHDCERHISTVHMGERLYTCHTCQVSFSRRDALHRHQTQKHVD